MSSIVLPHIIEPSGVRQLAKLAAAMVTPQSGGNLLHTK